MPSHRLNYDQPLPGTLITNIRKDLNHQKADGNCTMKSRSLIYVHNFARSLASEEHVLCQGGDLDRDSECMNDPLPLEIQKAWDARLGGGQETQSI